MLQIRNYKKYDDVYNSVVLYPLNRYIRVQIREGLKKLFNVDDVFYFNLDFDIAKDGICLCSLCANEKNCKTFHETISKILGHKLKQLVSGTNTHLLFEADEFVYFLNKTVFSEDPITLDYLLTDINTACDIIHITIPSSNVSKTYKSLSHALAEDLVEFVSAWVSDVCISVKNNRYSLFIFTSNCNTSHFDILNKIHNYLTNKYDLPDGFAYDSSDNSSGIICFNNLTRKKLDLIKALLKLSA